MRNKIIILSFLFILIMSTTCFASVNEMSTSYATALYDRLQENHKYYIDNINVSEITNRWDLTSASDLQEFYNTNETIQNFISENVTVENFSQVFFVQSSGAQTNVNLYVFYCDNNNSPIIEPSFIFNQFKFNNVPCIKIRIDVNGNLIVSSADITSQVFTSSTVSEYYYHPNYANQQAVIDDIIIETERDTISKVANFIPFIFNGSNIVDPFTKVNYDSTLYRLDNALALDLEEDEDNYFNYDFGQYFIRPYIEIDNVSGLVQSTLTIPFSVYSQSGDNYYPFNTLKMDLRVYEITETDNRKYSTLVDTYKRYSGNYVDTTNYLNVTEQLQILKYSYNLSDKFDSNFTNQYINTEDSTKNYAFQLVLYNFWEDEISSTKFFYFNKSNILNNNQINNFGDFNINNTDFNDLIAIFTTFMGTIMGFLTVLPLWLTSLIVLGITVAIILRIGGR